MSGNLRDQLMAVRAKYGELTPAKVVEEARPVDHPLHSRFEWDDSVAAEAWRREQAHELIRSVRVSYVDAHGHRNELRSFHAVRSGTGHVYQPVDEIVADDFATRILLQDMQREWTALKRRYERFAEFAEMVKADVA